MRRPTPLLQGSRPLRALGIVVVVHVLGGVLAAAEPARRGGLPGRSVVPRRPFFGAPAVPSPFPSPSPFSFSFPNVPQVPVPPALSGFGVTSPTDRCLVIPSPIDPRSLKVAASIDPGIFAEPRVQGLPVARPEWRPRR